MDNFWCSNYRVGDTTLIQNVSRPGHRYLIQNQQCAAPIVEQHINTKTHTSFAYKNTPKNLIVQCAATQKFTPNANRPQNSTLTRYDHSLECGRLTGCNRLWVDV